MTTYITSCYIIDSKRVSEITFIIKHNYIYIISCEMRCFCLKLPFVQKASIYQSVRYLKSNCKQIHNKCTVPFAP